MTPRPIAACNPAKQSLCKSCRIKSFIGYTHLIVELPSVHGENFGEGASYGA